MNKRKRTKKTIIEFIKFNVVGLINTAFTYGVYSLTVFLSSNYTFAVCMDYSIGICSSFFLNKYLTFKNRDKITAGMFLKMILSYVPSFVLNLISLHILIGQLNWNKYLAQLLTAACIAYISFILQKLFVFRHTQQKKNIIINGDFLSRNPRTGVERFAIETCIQLDALVGPGQLLIFAPSNSYGVPNLTNIKIVYSPKAASFYPVWEHIRFLSFVQKHHGMPLDFSNMTPVFCPGIAFIHDIYSVIHPDDFKTFREKLIRFYTHCMYRYTARHAKILITVSDFSRKQIAQTYKVNPESIHVIYNGWDHFKSIKTDSSIFISLPHIQKGNYYFTLGSLSKRKNLKWIAEHATKYPSETFIVSGKALSGLLPDELSVLNTLPNVVLPGYLSDGQIKALYENCKAFVFPSYYEGFGIPPLEALSCGAQIIISNSTCLPEIYGECAHYIDPDNADVNFDELLKEPVRSPDGLLQKYTYENAAQQLFGLISPIIDIK